jgi:hypothetical protein
MVHFIILVVHEIIGSWTFKTLFILDVVGSWTFKTLFILDVVGSWTFKTLFILDVVEIVLTWIFRVERRRRDGGRRGTNTAVSWWSGAGAMGGRRTTC